MISRQEFEHLLLLEKEFETAESIELGYDKWARNVLAPATKDIFQLNYYRGAIELKKFTYNKCFRKSIVLGRYDSRGKHTNPDGTVFDGPHVHIYDESFGDKIAYPISLLGLGTDAGLEEAFRAFISYFKVTNLPAIQTSII